MVNLILLLLLSIQQCIAFDYAEMEGFFKHTGAFGTQHGKDKDDPKYYESNSGIPHLPTVTGFMGTHGTYRFLTIHEQVALLIGDGKHGVWRIQDNGHIREYRKKGKRGIPKGVDPNNLDSQSTEERIEYINAIVEEYAAYIPEESWEGYKFPNDKISKGDGSYDNITDAQNFIDLTIYHPKYRNKYESHVPIDLPHFYCTMTQNNYKYMTNVWNYITKQPRANKIGPLGKRAGLDIRENYMNVIRFNFCKDAGVWANIGQGNDATDRVVKNLDELNSRSQTLNYQKVDDTKVNTEVYLFERPFFNKPYIFITLVMDSKANSKDYSYIRPHGPYFDELKGKGHTVLNTVVNHFPPAYIKGNQVVQKAYGLPVYGHHHPARHEHQQIGGACPSRGGDWGTYPWGNSGSGFPTNLEEVTPICDGFVIDMKLWWNLDQPTWEDDKLFLGNAAKDPQVTNNYTSDANIYGLYTDPYLIQNNATNPYVMNLSNKTIDNKEEKVDRVTFKLHFGKPGKYLDFVKVKDIGDGDERDESGYIGGKDVECRGKLMTSNLVFCLILAVVAVFSFGRL